MIQSVLIVAAILELFILAGEILLFRNLPIVCFPVAIVLQVQIEVEVIFIRFDEALLLVLQIFEQSV